MGRILTLRGVCKPGTTERIMLFDSNVTSTGWKILDFNLMNQTNGQYITLGLLSTIEKTYTFADWDPNQVVGVCKHSATGQKNMLLDYNHVVVGSLYLNNIDSSNHAAYLVVLEEIKIDDIKNIMYQLKESAQT
jgi:hypothetical protein